MNESELEAELRKLTLKAPAPSLAERIASDLRTVPEGRLIAIASSPTTSGARCAGVINRRRPGFFAGWRLLGWAVAGAAAMVLIWLNLNPSVGPVPGSKVALQSSAGGEATLAENPDESVDELIQATDEGLVYEEADEVPQRQVRMVYLERHTWTNPQTGAVVELEVPREDIVLMPVAMQ